MGTNFNNNLHNHYNNNDNDNDNDNKLYEKYNNNIIKFLDLHYAKNKIKLNQNLDINEFVIRFLPFVHLVNYWSQILALVISSCPDPKKRKMIIKNLYEENCEEYSHVDTFLLFIEEANINKINLKYNLAEIEKNSIIDNSIENITNFILHNTFDDSCQMLGSIEYIYHLISSDITSYINSETNFKPTFHYTVHEILDINHSYELFKANSKQIDEKNLKFGADWIINTINDLLTI